jgi:uncharacterized protein (TIGR00297 family)
VGIAWSAGALSGSGLWAAWLVGVMILDGTGWEGGAVLAAFFVSSSLVSRIASGAESLRQNPPLLDAKGNRRDAWQVGANGGPAALAAMLPLEPALKIWLVTASLAAAAADTWATSFGLLSRKPPRLLWSSRVVTPGTSGGVTATGTAGAAAGAALVAATSALMTGRPALLPLGTLIGFLGMVMDSLLGGTVQGRFHCPRCNQPSEWAVHRCGTPTQLLGGWAWLNNDVVNFLATALAAGTAWIVWWALDGLS